MLKQPIARAAPSLAAASALLLAACAAQVSWDEVSIADDPSGGLGGVFDMGFEDQAESIAGPYVVGAVVPVKLVKNRAPIPMERLDVTVDDPAVARLVSRFDGDRSTLIELLLVGEGDTLLHVASPRRAVSPPLRVVARVPDLALVRLAWQEPVLDGAALAGGEVLHVLAGARLTFVVDLFADDMGALVGDGVVALRAATTDAVSFEVLSSAAGHNGAFVIRADESTPGPVPMMVWTGSLQPELGLSVVVHGLEEVDGVSTIVGARAVQAAAYAGEFALIDAELTWELRPGTWLEGDTLEFEPGDEVPVTVCVVGTEVCADVGVPGTPERVGMNRALRCGCASGERPRLGAALALGALWWRRRARASASPSDA